MPNWKLYCTCKVPLVFLKIQGKHIELIIAARSMPCSFLHQHRRKSPFLWAHPQPSQVVLRPRKKQRAQGTGTLRGEQKSFPFATSSKINIHHPQHHSDSVVQLFYIPVRTINAFDASIDRFLCILANSKLNHTFYLRVFTCKIQKVNEIRSFHSSVP